MRAASPHPVVVVGAGPTGMMLAAELALAGVAVRVVERRRAPALEGARSGGLHARTIEVLDQRGVAERFVDAGQPAQVQRFGGTVFDLAGAPTRHPYGLALWQDRFEAILAGWVNELGVGVRRGDEVVGATQDDAGVDVELADGPPLRADYLVGCDGGRSRVRAAAGITTTETEAVTSWLVAEATFEVEPPRGLRQDRLGTHGLAPLADGWVRLVLTEEHLGGTGPARPSSEDLRRALGAVYGGEPQLREVRWLSRFTDATRLAADYRHGRILLAGDAAHVHPPNGGQGLNIGVQDAVNLGWKLAQVVKGVSPASLLDTYHAERHPVGAWAVRTALAQVALALPGDRHEALRDTVANLLADDQERTRMAALLSGLDLRYDLGGGHPLVGRRMPDLGLRTAHGRTRVYELLHDARPLLLRFDGASAGAGALMAGVDEVAVTDEDPWELPVVGLVDAPLAVLVRPDGYVAWAGDPADPGFGIAGASWFGATLA